MKTSFLCAVVVLLIVESAYSLTAKQYLNNVITLFNEGEYEAIYNTFSSKYKTAKIKAATLQNMTQFNDQYGDILTNVTMPSTSNSAVALISFKEDLTIGTAAAFVLNGKAQYAIIYVAEQSSFVNYVNRYSRFIGFKFIFDDQTISKNSGDSFRVGALQVFPVTIEFCNQVAQGKIKSTKVVTRKELQKYYINGYDENFFRFSINSSISQTLGSLVKQNLQTPSLAVSEYLVDLLGLENVEKTMDALGISQDRTMYPASFLVQVANISIAYENELEFSSKYAFDTSDSEITDENLRIHQILKTGNAAAKKLLNLTISVLETGIEATKTINRRNTEGTAGDYADAFENFRMKDFELDGNMNKILSNFNSLKGTTSSSSTFGSGTTVTFSTSGIGKPSYGFFYQAMGGYVVPKKASYKSLSFCIINTETPSYDPQFQQTFALFLMNLLVSPEFRSAAADFF